MDERTLKKPKWCNYPKDELGDATTPGLGCWSLLNGRADENFCKTKCELYNENK